MPRRLAIPALLWSSTWAAGATAQTFLPQGPSPIFGNAQQVQSIDAPPNGTSVGAVQSLLVHPHDSNRMYLGAVNGGVWATNDAGTTWRPMGDTQRSLSIASLAADPGDFNTIVAGTGVTSSSLLGGPKIGVLFSSNGGASWSVKDQGLPDVSIVGVAVRGSTILAAAAEPFDLKPSLGGLFRSVGGGAFQQVQFGANGNVAVTSLAAGVDPRTFFASVLSGSADQNGIWTSTDSGQTWSIVQALAPGTTARLATGPKNSVAAAVYDTSGLKMQGVMLSHDGKPFVTLNVPLPNTSTPDTSLTFPGTFANRLLPVAIDPGNRDILYMASTDLNVNDIFSVAAVRIVVSDLAKGEATVEPLTLDGTSNGSSAHADARDFAFDSSGRLYMTTDGGVYVRTDRSNQQAGTGAWTGLNTSGLQLGEAYGVAFDAVSKRVVVAAQDIGVSYQKEPNGRTFFPLTGGDGHNAAAINDRTRSNESAVYTSAQNLSVFTRWTLDTQGAIVTHRVFPTTLGEAGVLNFAASDFTEICSGSTANCLPFASKLELNKTDPSMMAIGTNYIYTTTDANAGSDTLVLSQVGAPFAKVEPCNNVDPCADNKVTALAYGTLPTPNALLVGLQPSLGLGGKGLWFSSTGSPNSLQPTAYAGQTPTSVLFDPRSADRFFAVDNANLWSTTNAGASFSNALTSNLASLNVILPSSLEFVHANGVDALLVGGVNGVGQGQSPVAVADSDSSGNLSNWRQFGLGLPNTIVYQMSYNPTVDVLAMSLLGRGAWTLSDVTTYFPTATVLRFGLADNDSTPPPSILTNGIYGQRNLEKVGSGNLTITGTTAYTGLTNVLQGALIDNGDMTSSSGMIVGPNGTLRGSGLLPSTVVSGTIAPGNSIGPLTVNGNLTLNPGSTYQVEANAAGQADRINVNGAASLNGSVQVQPQAGNYARNTSYTILNATGGVSGAFSGVTSDFAFLHPFLGYDANNVYLTLMFGSFAAGAQTANQYAVGRALDAATSTSGDFGTVLDALAGLGTAQAPGVLDAISGQPYANFGSLNLQGSALFMNVLGQQMAMARGGAGTGSGQRQPLAQACLVETCETAGPWGTWASALGGLGSIAGNGNAASFSYGFGGGAGGIDYRVDPGLLLGFAAGYASGNQWVNGFAGRGWSDAVSAAVYGSFTRSAFYADALAGYAYANNQMQRPIAIPGLQPRIANSSTGANQVLGQVESGYRVPVDAASAAAVTPFARLQVASVSQAGFSEWGANSLNLSVAQQTTNSVRSVLGLDLSGGIGLGNTRKLDVALRLGWQHEFADIARPISAAFSGAPGNTFTVYGASPQRDAAIVGLSASSAVAEATSVYLRYDGEIASGNDNHALNVGLRVTW